MAPELSGNWKKLQYTLKQESSKTASQKLKTEPSRRQQNSVAKRRRLYLQAAKIVPSIESARKRAKMGLGSSVLPKPKELVTSTSLMLWAEDNDISSRDLAEAYGLGVGSTTQQSASPESVNEGLSKGVEIGDCVAMDCEMVGVGGKVDENKSVEMDVRGDRSVLARVSIVNLHGAQVYDSFVKPEEFVTDWRTKISGVSAKDMATARNFRDVQVEVAGLLKERVLVGHGIKHDLEVMMLNHPEKDKRDTARFSGFRKYSAGRTPSLKKLAKEVLDIDIQGGQHSSIEDARVAMLLYRRLRQALDAEHLKRFPQRRNGNKATKTKPKRRTKQH